MGGSIFGSFLTLCYNMDMNHFHKPEFSWELPGEPISPILADRQRRHAAYVVRMLAETNLPNPSFPVEVPYTPRDALETDFIARGLPLTGPVEIPTPEA